MLPRFSYTPQGEQERIQMRGLQDKVAIVTGAGSGLGRGMALRLAEEGVTAAHALV